MRSSAALRAVSTMTGTSPAARAAQHFLAVHVGQAQIQQHQPRRALVQHPDGLGAARGGQHRQPGPLQVAAQQFPDLPFILDYEDAAGHRTATA